jgi:N-methylhydantoinase A
MAGIVAIDVGGTFTDCVLVDKEGNVHVDKAFTTPENVTEGILNAINNIKLSLGQDQKSALSELSAFCVGTTSILNRLVSRTGARVGLLTTRGHEDALIIGRVALKADGLSARERSDPLLWEKPEPIVPRALIKGITERMDYKGSVVCPLDEDGVAAAADAVVAAGAESIAICFLWAFRNPDHERRARAIVQRQHPRIDVTLSSEIAPMIGEYERAATTVINAYLRPGAHSDFATLSRDLEAGELRVEPLIMQSTGGLTDTGSAEKRPVYLLSSGPVGGVSGAAKLASILSHDNIITTDMGGTSFDVGLLVKGVPELSRQAIYGRYRVLVPAIGVISIGAGGGSIARASEGTQTLHVGPDSAGSRPGPVCYGFGGGVPTVTDADLVLGRISADRFFAGRKRLNLQAAREAIQARIAKPLGLSEIEAAEGIVEIVDAHMADLVRKVTIERGYDPRDFILLAFGGGGPVHVGRYASDVGVKAAVVPAQAAVFSAFGIAFSDVLRNYTISQPQTGPFKPDRVQSIFDQLESLARKDMPKAAWEDTVIQRAVDMRFRSQAHVVRVPVSGSTYSEEFMEQLIQRFLALYEEIYGKGTAYREAGIEMVTFRLSAITPVPRPELRPNATNRGTKARELGSRKVRFSGNWIDTPVFEMETLPGEAHFSGPAIFEGRTTTLVVHPGQIATTDRFGNVLLHFPDSSWAKSETGDKA